MNIHFSLVLAGNPRFNKDVMLSAGRWISICSTFLGKSFYGIPDTDPDPELSGQEDTSDFGGKLNRPCFSKV